MSHYKIIFTGPVGAGKTTAIQSISDIPPINTDVSVKGMSGHRKSTTTVAMDYGLTNLGSGEKIHLYGTPGQERFDFMWDILANWGNGSILLLDNTSADPFKDMRFYLQAFKKFLADANIVIGITQMDISGTPAIADYQAQFQDTGSIPPIFAIDARVKEDVSLLVQSLVYSLRPALTG